jgi:hypothetical protein
MHVKTTLAVVAAAAVMLFAAPQGASALPQANGAKQLNSSNVEKTGYYDGRRNGWRRGYYRRNYGYGRRHYRRRPGFGIYLGF